MDDEEVGFTDAPSVDESKSLTQLGTELFQVEEHIEELNLQLEAAKERRLQLTMKELPDYMLRVGQDKMGLEEWGVDLIREQYYHANIKAEWPEEQRQAAFQWLTDNGHEDLIKTVFTIQFPRRMYEVALWLSEKVKTLRFPGKGKEIAMPDASVALGVPWNTLTAFVREQVEAGNELPLETLGATVGWIVKVKKRKGK
jgi:hypothetical protein